jgi:hypothetical protein
MGRKILSIHSWDAVARKKLFGTEPKFIFDPRDKSNEAVPESEDPLREAGANAIIYWKIYPNFLREAFVKSFTTGLSDPDNGRVTLGQWRRLLSSLVDAILYCPSCKAENFYDQDALTNGTTERLRCWNPKCNVEIVMPFRIQIGKSIIMLSHDAKLYPHHLNQSDDFDFSEAVAAEVVPNPADPRIWGLKNCTASKWVATTAAGESKDVEPGKSIKLANETVVKFGKTEGVIKY